MNQLSNVFAVREYEANGELQKKYIHVGTLKVTQNATYLNLGMFADTTFIVLPNETSPDHS
jgi:hypothetical protein